MLKKILTIEQWYNLAIKRLSLKDYSKSEMIQYLQKRDCNMEYIEFIMQKLISYGYINDEKLCARLCQNWQANGGYGKLILKQRLFKRGFCKDTIQNALEGLEDDDEYDMAKKVFLLYIKKIKTVDKKNIDKIWRYMLSKGFKYSSINKVFKNNEQQLLKINENASLDTYFKNLYN